MNVQNNAYNNACNLAAWQGTGPWASLDRLRDSVCSIVRCDAFMKRIFSHTVAALIAGLCLRLFFAFKFPFAPTDTALYEQLATNWLQHHIYAVTVDGTLVPVDLRMPGYPAFLAIIYAITGRIGPDARLYVTLVQAVVDLGACLLTAGLAAMLALLRPNPESWRRVYIATLWIAALCPFTANYAAVPMTEVFAWFFTAAASVSLIALIWRECGGETALFKTEWATRHSESIFALTSGFLIGMGTLFRPETPLLLVVAWILLAFIWLRKRRFLFFAQLVVLSAIGCALPLAPWAVRNAVTLHEVQFLAPKNLNMSGEFVPRGFMAWEKTWLFRMKDCFLVPWKLDDEVINLEDIPARAFDTPDEKDRVAALLEHVQQRRYDHPRRRRGFREARARAHRAPPAANISVAASRASIHHLVYAAHRAAAFFGASCSRSESRGGKIRSTFPSRSRYFLVECIVRRACIVGSVTNIAGELRARAGRRFASWLHVAAHSVSNYD